MEFEYDANAGDTTTHPTTLKLINSGTYGCIFRPGLNCRGKPESLKYVTKIQKYSNDVKNEWRVSQKILKISGYSRFFAPILKQCKVRIAKEPAKELRKCPAFSSIPEQNLISKHIVSTKIRYMSGGDLRDYIMHRVPKTRVLSELWRTHYHVLKALQKLGSNGIVHYDLKDNNILFDTELNVPIIIDFGLSFLKSDLKPDNYKNVFFTFDDYSYWCIDIIACSYIFSVIGYSRAKTEMVKQDQLLEIRNTFLYGRDYKINASEPVNIVFFNSDVKIQEFKDAYKIYFDQFLEKSWWNMYEELIKFVESWDNYSVAVIYSKLLDKTRLDNPDNYEKIANANLAALNKYMRGLDSVIYAMPDKRFSIMDMEKCIPK